MLLSSLKSQRKISLFTKNGLLLYVATILINKLHWLKINAKTDLRDNFLLKWKKWFHVLRLLFLPCPHPVYNVHGLYFLWIGLIFLFTTRWERERERERETDRERCKRHINSVNAKQCRVRWEPHALAHTHSLSNTRTHTQTHINTRTHVNAKQCRNKIRRETYLTAEQREINAKFSSAQIMKRTDILFPLSLSHTHTHTHIQIHHHRHLSVTFLCYLSVLLENQNCSLIHCIPSLPLFLTHTHTHTQTPSSMMRKNSQRIKKEPLNGRFEELSN